MRKLTLLITTLGLMAFSACTVKGVEAPPLAGPSTLSKDFNLKVSRDILTQNGSDFADVTVDVKDPAGKPVTGMPLRAEIQVGGVTQDFGSLNTKSSATNSSGQAVFRYTAPPLPAAGLVAQPQLVTIAITPEGSDFGGERSRTVDIKIQPPGIFGPNNPTLVAAFDVAPNPPTAFSTAAYDASKSTNNGSPCSLACAYSWNFGDGTTSSGIKTTHEFRSSGSKTVSLTVTDSLGATAVAVQTLAVIASPPPTGTVINNSPSAPGVGEDIIFTATGTLPAAGRTIVSHTWTFGDGESASGTSVTHRYRTPGTYSVVLNVTDDANSVLTVVKSLTIVTGAPVADLKFSPATPKAGFPVFFDASASTSATSSIVSYRFVYGDGSEETSTVPTQSHTYASAIPGKSATDFTPYTATVFVTDALGRTSSKQVPVPVIP